MSVQETYLQGIADAIRAKTGETSTIQASKFAEKIAAISTGASLPVWTKTTLPNSLKWNALAYGNGMFVALGYRDTGASGTPVQICARGTGYSWSSIAITGALWQGATYGKGVFVVVGTDAAAYSTDNGASWIKPTGIPSGAWISVAYGNGVFVAVASGSSGAAMYSSDGKTWTKVSISALRQLQKVIYGNGIFVAIGYSMSSILTSKDGKTWTTVSLGVSKPWRDIAYDKGYWVIIEENGTIMYSIDGTDNWYQSSLPASSWWNSVVGGNGKFVVFSSSKDNKFAYVSTHLVATTSRWTEIITPFTVSAPHAVFGDGLFVMVDAGGYAQNKNTAGYLRDSFSAWA